MIGLFELMRDYAAMVKAPYWEELPHPELGKSLALLHTCLLEAGMDRDDTPGTPRVMSPPSQLKLNHLSRFVVGFLPFNSVTSKEETNEILFDVYAFVSWLDKNQIAHGWSGLNFSDKVRALLTEQKRCLELSHFLDEESGRVLEDPPKIAQTIADLFAVVKIDDRFVTLQGSHHDDPVRIGLPRQILQQVRPGDHLDLVLGDTTEKWILLEAGQVFPEFETGESATNPTA